MGFVTQHERRMKKTSLQNKATQYHKLRVVDMRILPHYLKCPAQEGQSLAGSWQGDTRQWSGG